MGKQSKKKRQQRQKQQRKDDEVVGAALEAQVARLRRLQLSREACGTEGQEHPNDDLARAEACGFRVCDARAEAQREERGAQVDAADLDTRPSPGPSDSDGGDGGDGRKHSATNLRVKVVSQLHHQTRFAPLAPGPIAPDV